jgi:hypothetical protein
MRLRMLILIVAAPALTMFCGCRHPTEKASILAGTFVGTGFEPELSMRRQGFVVKSSQFSDGATDLARKCYWHSWQGVVTVPGETNACMTVSRVIRDEFSRAFGAECEDELTTKGYRLHRGQPFWGSLYHENAAGTVDVRVWLIPHEETTKLSYVIYLRAADLPK